VKLYIRCENVSEVKKWYGHPLHHAFGGARTLPLQGAKKFDVFLYTGILVTQKAILKFSPRWGRHVGLMGFHPIGAKVH